MAPFCVVYPFGFLAGTWSSFSLCVCVCVCVQVRVRVRVPLSECSSSNIFILGDKDHFLFHFISLWSFFSIEKQHRLLISSFKKSTVDVVFRFLIGFVLDHLLKLVDVHYLVAENINFWWTVKIYLSSFQYHRWNRYTMKFTFWF